MQGTLAVFSLYIQGDRAFAVCQGHTAKVIFPTVKGLPCVAYGKQYTANKRQQRAYLPCVIFRAHDKEFAEC